MAKDFNFKDAERDISGILSRAEKATLIWLAERMPRFINSDHLTILGLFGMFMAGFFFYMAKFDLSWLHAVNVALVINWFGDSLDGTIARVRKHQRPRYGYYVDHICDVFGIVFYMLGVAFSGLITFELAIALLVIFLVLSAHVYLATHVSGVFKISFGGFGPTELRIILVLGNILVFFSPIIHLNNVTFLMLDVVGLPVAIALLAILLVAVSKTTAELYDQERIP